MSRGQVWPRELEAATVVELDDDGTRLPVDVGDGAPVAVGDAEAAVVAGAEDAVADGALGSVGEAETVAAEASLAVEQCAGDGVEFGDVAAPVGDHHAAGEICSAACHQSAISRAFASTRVAATVSLPCSAAYAR